MKGRVSDNILFALRHPSLTATFLVRKRTHKLDFGTKEKMKAMYELEVAGNSELQILENYLTPRLSSYYSETLKLGFVPDIIDKLVNYNYGNGLGILDYSNCRLLYSIIRHEKPMLVVETGVASGASSYSILQAMKRNGFGRLYSIDLPQQMFGNVYYIQTERVPEGKTNGWLVPDNLRENWELILGDSRTELPKLFERLKSIDIFIHDSLHTYEHMMFEYTAAWKCTKYEGLLISDDINANNAFDDFTEGKGLKLNRLGIHRKV